MKRFLLLTLILSAFSCSIEKRLHQPGWHVEWKKRHVKSHENNSVINYQPRYEAYAEDISGSVSVSDSNFYVIAKSPDDIIQSEQKVVENTIPSILKIKAKKINSGSNNTLIKKSFKIIENRTLETEADLEALDIFVVIISLICILLVAGGILAIVFGQHWIWLVLGILLIILSIIVLLSFLITIGLGYSVAREFEEVY